MDQNNSKKIWKEGTSDKTNKNIVKNKNQGKFFYLYIYSF